MVYLGTPTPPKTVITLLCYQKTVVYGIFVVQTTFEAIGQKMAIFKYCQNTPCGYSKVVPEDAWQDAKGFRSIWSFNPEKTFKMRCKSAIFKHLDVFSRLDKCMDLPFHLVRYLNIDYQLLSINYQTLIINYPLSIVNFQLSITKYQVSSMYHISQIKYQVSSINSNEQWAINICQLQVSTSK